VSQYKSITTQQCHNTTVSQYKSVTIQKCHNTTVSQHNSVTIQKCHNTKVSQHNSVTIQNLWFSGEKFKVLKCCNFLWVQQRHNCSPAASFANCVMTLYLLIVNLQMFLSIPITQKCQILSSDTLVAKWAIYSQTPGIASLSLRCDSRRYIAGGGKSK